MNRREFYHLLIGKTKVAILSIFIVAVLYVWLMTIIDHKIAGFSLLVLLLATLKSFLISFTTMRQLSRLAERNYSFERLLLIFGLLIGLTVFSFATDFSCLYEYDVASFTGISPSYTHYLDRLFQFFYFSMITFSTVGYGGIAPNSTAAQYLIMLEISISFLIIVFAFANLKNRESHG